MGIEFQGELEQVTIGGYVFNLLGRLPMVGDTIKQEGIEFVVLEMDGARIKRLKVIKIEESTKQSKEDKKS